MANTERFEMRVSKQFIKMIDDWRRLQDPLPTRGEAVRFLCEKAVQADLAAAHAQSYRAVLDKSSDT
jgi:hypothetical protein